MQKIPWLHTLALAWLMLAGQSVQAQTFNPRTLLSNMLNPPAVRQSEFSYAIEKSQAQGDPARECLLAGQSLVQNSKGDLDLVVNTRCALVMSEVCMQQKTGAISQSQSSGKQCEIIKGLAGAQACEPACSDAGKLKSGGSATVQTPYGSFAGLTDFALSCYTKILGTHTGDPNTCETNQAMQCLINASADQAVNAQIRAARQQSCQTYYAHWKSTGSKHACLACITEGEIRLPGNSESVPLPPGLKPGDPRVDFNAKVIDLDPRFCNPRLAAQGHCKMP